MGTPEETLPSCSPPPLASPPSSAIQAPKTFMFVRIASTPNSVSTSIRRLLLLPCFLAVVSGAGAEKINRHALVTRHDVTVTKLDATNPLSVGNGRFCFSVDATGLQTFPEAFKNTTPLATLSDWGWHTAPNPKGWRIDKFGFTKFPDLRGRPVPYCDIPGGGRTPEVQWLRTNPHRLHLGQIGLRLKHADGSPARPDDLTDIAQKLDLWNGEIVSRFKFDGRPVEVRTICDPGQDAIAVRIISPLVEEKRLGIQIRFPYATGATETADWSKPDAHHTTLKQGPSNAGHFQRKLDNDTYVVDAKWSASASITNPAKHEYRIEPGGKSDELELVAAFAPEKNSGPDGFSAIQEAARRHWNQFWQTGGTIDLSGSKDPRWFELERRIVLSQYLLAIQDAGAHPPQETGLTYNSWEGKFHLEMHWWHEAQFALWDRLPLFERSLGYYQKILPRAQDTARKQGYAGARWPKMTGPGGEESPSIIGPFLIWQQPHPIFYAELCWRQRRDKATLEKFRAVVFQTAEFMASYAAWDAQTKRYVLGPTLQCAQEIFPKDKTFNPTFELTYWRWGLETAQQWRQRLGLPREKKWDEVLNGLARPPVTDGKYAFAETTPDSYTNPTWNRDHPSVAGALGMLPGPQIDAPTMRATFDWIMKKWNWPSTWGWDYPMLAMTAARLGDPERAVSALLLDAPKNRYGRNGHVYQSRDLTIYLPANGGLLYAVAMMAGGWDGAPKRNAPGFPDNGQWTVRWENLHPAP